MGDALQATAGSSQSVHLTPGLTNANVSITLLQEATIAADDEVARVACLTGIYGAGQPSTIHRLQSI